jgi:ParB family chromosome partitioning protein
MAERPDFRGLGKRLLKSAGLGADQHPVDDFVDNDDPARVVLLPLDTVRPNPDQPRTYFDAASLDSLATSIREHGLLQPVIARRDPEGDGYILVDGERRWRAAGIAGLAKLPALIRQREDSEEVALIANVQREDLNAIDQAEALLRLKKRQGYTDAQLARIVGKSRSSITEALSLNQLPEVVKAESRTSDKWTKSQLLQVLRAGSPENVATVWDSLRGGEPPPVRTLRQKTATSKGRRKHYTFTYQPDDRHFRLSLTFSKARVAGDQVKEALQQALKTL